MKRHRLALPLIAGLTGCYDVSNPGTPILVVSPIIDSTFVGDSLPARTVTYLDANRDTQPTGPVTWSIDPHTVAQVDNLTGEIHAVGRGEARLTAQARGLTALALVIVSRPLDMALLLDTVYLMPNDTITLPVAVQQKNKPPLGTPATVRFSIPTNAVDSLADSTTGLVKALSTGGPIPYIARAAAGTDTVADTGAVIVMTLSDTTGGRGFFTVLGTAIRHEGGPALALNYRKFGDTLAFRLVDSLIVGNDFYERLTITLRFGLDSTGSFDIDSLNPQEAAAQLSQLNAICNPPRPWALWSSILPLPGIRAFSRQGGRFTVTQNVRVPGGQVISGRYLFRAQRTDLYSDSLGVLTIRGTFVAPLTTNRNTCRP